MRYLKTVGAIALGVVAMMVAASGASATILTSPPATTKVGVGTKIKAESESIQWDGWINPGCTKLTLEGEVSNAGGPETTVSGAIQQLAFWGCAKDTISVIQLGSFELHATGGGNGTLTWSGGEITVQLHRTSFGVPVTTHCIFVTQNTHIGTLTGSSTTKGTAALDIGTALIPKAKTDSFCGEEPAVLTGEAQFTSPDYLDVDGEVLGTILTSSTGTMTLGAGAKIKAESGGTISMDGAVDLACQKSTLDGEVNNAGGAGATVSAQINSLTLTECGNDTASVLKPGSLELHATNSSNGTLTWSGAEITVQLHRKVFGFPITTHCIYKINNTHIGTFTGSATTGGTATLDIGSPQIPVDEEQSDGACGSSAELTGDYKFTTPDYLDVD